jgi:hypothetical protein
MGNVTIAVDGQPVTVSATQQSVMDAIPVDLHADIVLHTATADVTAFIQAAFDRAAKTGVAGVFFPPGRYPIKGSLYLKNAMKLFGPSTSAWVNSSNVPELFALGTMSAMITMESTIGVASVSAPEVAGMYFNLANKATAGIYVSDTINARINNCSFANIAANCYGILGGGLLYPIITGNYFAGSGRAIDLFSANRHNGSQEATGWQVGYFALNNVYTRQGMRITGTGDIVFNDIECFLDAPVVLDTVDPAFGSPSQTISNNYFEIHTGTATNAACLQLAGGNMAVLNNRFYGNGPAGGYTAIAGGAGGALSTIIQSNLFSNWATGCNINTSQTALVQNSSHVTNNTFISVTTPVTGGLFSTASRSTTLGAGFVYNAVVNKYTFTGRAVGFNCFQTADMPTSLDLGAANNFKIVASGAHTISAITNAKPGDSFVIHFASANTTLANTVFNLIGGIDKTFLKNSIAQFITDFDGVVRQITN